MGVPQGNRLDGRNGEIWKWYVRGLTQEALAEKYEISQARVSQIIAQVRESIPPEDKDKVRQEHLELARTMRAELARLVDMDPIPAYSNGRPIMIADDDGNEKPAEDHSGRLAAMDRLTKWIERESKLLGVDAPTKVEASVALSEQDAAQALAAEAAARMAERGDDA
jgi:transcriptional regulator with XRE-family HTH domain